MRDKWLIRMTSRRVQLELWITLWVRKLPCCQVADAEPVFTPVALKQSPYRLLFYKKIFVLSCN
jgi:hypothetical protein